VFFYQVSQGSKPLPRLLISVAYNGQGPPTSECFFQLKTACSARNGAPKEAEEPYLRPFVSRRREMAKPVPTKAFLLPAKAAAMCMAPHAETRSTATIHLFCYRKTYLPNGLRLHCKKGIVITTDSLLCLFVISDSDE